MHSFRNFKLRIFTEDKTFGDFDLKNPPIHSIQVLCFIKPR